MVDYFDGNKKFSDLYISTLGNLDSLYFRNKIYYEFLYLWLDNRNNNKTIAKYLDLRNIHKIAIYGGGNLGKLLYDELEGERKGLIKYIIDECNVDNKFGKLPVIRLENIDQVENVDAIIITPIYAAEEIKMNLKSYSLENFMCLDEIICDLQQEKLNKGDCIK